MTDVRCRENQIRFFFVSNGAISKSNRMF